MQAFKHFDTVNSGVVEPEVFAKVIDKLGFTISTK
jgi:Ca2+-binding EF-hand superfamily protein